MVFTKKVIISSLLSMESWVTRSTTFSAQIFSLGGFQAGNFKMCGLGQMSCIKPRLSPLFPGFMQSYCFCYIFTCRCKNNAVLSRVWVKRLTLTLSLSALSRQGCGVIWLTQSNNTVTVNTLQCLMECMHIMFACDICSLKIRWKRWDK